MPEPTADEVAALARRTAERVVKVLDKLGRSLDPEMDAPPDSLEVDHPALAGCYGTAAPGIDLLGERAGQPTLRDAPPPRRLPESTPEMLG